MPLLKNYRKLKASSLLESVIAISIISICILVAFSAYLNVVNRKKAIGYFNAKHKIEAWTRDIISTSDYDDDIFISKDFTIEKLVQINKDEHTASLKFIITSSQKNYILEKQIPYTLDHEN